MKIGVGLLVFFLSSFAFLGKKEKEVNFQYFSFVFKGNPIELDFGMKYSNQDQDGNVFFQDTLSNVYYPRKKYIEIIRQDHPHSPKYGIALGFEFDENNGEYPYSPSFAVLQLKDFGYGGVTFDKRDTSNYTGVSNAISEDISVEIDGFDHDTIYGRFSGMLLSGAGAMSSIEGGKFKIKLVERK